MTVQVNGDALVFKIDALSRNIPRQRDGRAVSGVLHSTRQIGKRTALDKASNINSRNVANESTAINTQLHLRSRVVRLRVALIQSLNALEAAAIDRNSNILLRGMLFDCDCRTNSRSAVSIRYAGELFSCRLERTVIQCQLTGADFNTRIAASNRTTGNCCIRITGKIHTCTSSRLCYIIQHKFRGIILILDLSIDIDRRAPVSAAVRLAGQLCAVNIHDHAIGIGCTTTLERGHENRRPCLKFHPGADVHYRIVLILSIVRTFDIDRAQIRRSFIDLTRACHSQFSILNSDDRSRSGDAVTVQIKRKHLLLTIDRTDFKAVIQRHILQQRNGVAISHFEHSILQCLIILVTDLRHSIFSCDPLFCHGHGHQR